MGSFTSKILIGNLFICLMNEHYIVLLIYLSYYSIAYSIKLLEAKLVLTKTTNPFEHPFSIDSKKILLHIHRANSALGSVFSIPVLYMITIQLTIASFILFLTIYGLIRHNELLSNNVMTSTLMIELFRTLLSVFLMLFSADMPVKQVIR